MFDSECIPFSVVNEIKKKVNLSTVRGVLWRGFLLPNEAMGNSNSSGSSNGHYTQLQKTSSSSQKPIKRWPCGTITIFVVLLAMFCMSFIYTIFWINGYHQAAQDNDMYQALNCTVTKAGEPVPRYPTYAPPPFTDRTYYVTYEVSYFVGSTPLLGFVTFNHDIKRTAGTHLHCYVHKDTQKIIRSEQNNLGIRIAWIVVSAILTTIFVVSGVAVMVSRILAYKQIKAERNKKHMSMDINQTGMYGGPPQQRILPVANHYEPNP